MKVVKEVSKLKLTELISCKTLVIQNPKYNNRFADNITQAVISFLSFASSCLTTPAFCKQTNQQANTISVYFREKKDIIEFSKTLLHTDLDFGQHDLEPIEVIEASPTLLNDQLPTP